MVNITSYSSCNDFSYAQHAHVHLTPCPALEFIKHTDNGVRHSCTLWRDGSETRRLDVSLPTSIRPPTAGWRKKPLMFTDVYINVLVSGQRSWTCLCGFSLDMVNINLEIYESRERKIRWVMNWILILV